MESAMSGYTITSERIDDVPLVMAWLAKMQVATIVDTHLPKPHGNRQGVSYGQLSVLYLTYLLTQCNHFLSPVQEWAEQRKECLAQLLGAPLRPTDCTDDRLQDLLDVLGEQARACEEIEIEMGPHLLRAYALPTKTARIDTTTVSVYHQPDDQSLLTFGHSKDPRPDLRQFKEALGTLDPVGIPLCSVTLNGACADDPVYVPVWRQMVKIVGHADFLCVGDCKMAALQTRATLQKEGGCYLAPVPMTGETPALLKQLLTQGADTAEEIVLVAGSPEPVRVGAGFEVSLPRTHTDPTTKQTVSWSERTLVMCSDKLRERHQKHLRQRLQQAEQALLELNAKPQTDPVRLQKQCQALLKRFEMQDYLSVSYTNQTQQTKRYLKGGRHTEDTPFLMLSTTLWQVEVLRQEEALWEADATAGWRLFVTNAAPQQWSLQETVACYREPWQPEHGFHRIKGGSLAVRPLLLRSDARIRGLMFLLLLALRFLCLFEFVVRRNLQDETQGLAGLYAGNPKRLTFQPTTERLLRAFDGITLYRMERANKVFWQVTVLSDLQRRRLSLANLPETVYDLHDTATKLPFA
jgi:transposase